MLTLAARDRALAGGGLDRGRDVRLLRRGGRRGLLPAHPSGPDAAAVDRLGGGASGGGAAAADPALAALLALDFLAADVFTSGDRDRVRGSLDRARGADARRVPRARRARRRRGALGALAAAPQIVATALWIPQTNRAVLGMKLVDSVLLLDPSLAPPRARRALSLRRRLGDSAASHVGLARSSAAGRWGSSRRSTAEPSP